MPHGADSDLQTPGLPPPPSPSADASIAPPSHDPIHEDHAIPSSDEEVDIFTLKALSALRILSTLLEDLQDDSNQIPIPPRRLSRSQDALRTSHIIKTGTEDQDSKVIKENRRKSSQWTSDDVDVPPRAKTPIGSPDTRPQDSTVIVDTEVGHESESMSEEYAPHRAAVIRKFYSKKPPPICLQEYLMRLHRYCPMSTAVYLATGLYIYQLVMVDRLLTVTSRNAHRLVLAGLRVAMKALEDLSYPHSRFAKVGGVSEIELGRLEISFCFVRDFNLRVTSEALTEYLEIVRRGDLHRKEPSLPEENSILIPYRSRIQHSEDEHNDTASSIDVEDTGSVDITDD